MFDRDQPRLATFRPQKPLDVNIIDENLEVLAKSSNEDLATKLEQNLAEMIANRQIVNALRTYKMMCDEEIPVSAQNKVKLAIC